MIRFNFNKIRELRNIKGLTQSQFADRIGVSSAAVCQWERGLRLPQLFNIEVICNEFGVEPNYFFS